MCTLQNAVYSFICAQQELAETNSNNDSKLDQF